MKKQPSLARGVAGRLGEASGQPMHRLTKRQIVSLVAFTAIYAVCFAAIKAGLVFAPPLRFAGWRAFIAGVAVLAVAVWLRHPGFPRRRNWPALLGLALTSTTVAFAAMFLSPGRTGAGIASVLGNTQPLFAIVLGKLILREPMTRNRITALVLGLAGVTLITYPVLDSDAYAVGGAALALMASASTAAGSVIAKRIRMQDELLAITAWQLILGSLPLFVASAAVEREAPIIWSGPFVGLLLFLALIGTSLVTVMWYWLVEHDQVSRLTLFLFLVPAFGLVVAALTLGERINLVEIVGIGVIVAGISLVVREAA